MEESISLEETNKIYLEERPLMDDKAPAYSDEKQTEVNYAGWRKEEQGEKDSRWAWDSHDSF